MDEVVPANPMERFFTVVLWIVGFICATLLLSTMSANHTQLFIIGESRTRKFAMLRKYLRQNNISRNLAQRMQRNANHALEGDLVEAGVELLPVISESLRVEMHFEVFSRVLLTHCYLGDYVY